MKWKQQEKNTRKIVHNGIVALNSFGARPYTLLIKLQKEITTSNSTKKIKVTMSYNREQDRKNSN